MQLELGADMKPSFVDPHLKNCGLYRLFSHYLLDSAPKTIELCEHLKDRKVGGEARHGSAVISLVVAGGALPHRELCSGPKHEPL